MGFLLKRTSGDDFPDNLKILLSGSPKAGKTSFLGTIPNIIVADTEPHANNLQSIAHLNVPYLAISGTSDLQQLLMVLRDDALRKQVADQAGMPKVEAVAIDTLDTLQEIMKRERLQEQRRTQFQRDDWGWLKEEMTNLVKEFTSLPMHVIFTVHTKSTQVGDENEGKTIVLPGLEGAIAEKIAGMVGYSLLAFRRQEIRPDGSPYTKYWLRAEGDETHDYLGNRAAGRLPDIIEPNFAAVYKAAMDGRRQAQQAQQTQVQIATTQTSAAPAVPTPGQAPVQTAPVAPQPTPAPVAVQTAPEAPATPVTVSETSQTAPVDDGNDPISDAAIPHVKQVFDALGETFPEYAVRELTMNQARNLVRMWKAVQGDHAEGRTSDPKGDMIEYLEALELVAPAGPAVLSYKPSAPVDVAPVEAAPAPVQTPVETAVAEQPSEPAEAPAAPVQEDVQAEPQSTITPDINGTIAQVLAYVGDDPVRAQEAYDAEVERSRPRQTLLNSLQDYGAKPPAVEPILPEAIVEPVAQFVETPAPIAQATAVATEPPTVQSPEEPSAALAKAEEVVYQILGGVPVDDNGVVKPCEACGNPVDDTDIAQLAKSRFGHWFCTQDYIEATKKPAA